MFIHHATRSSPSGWNRLWRFNNLLRWIIPLHGICQGNRAGPAIWVVLLVGTKLFYLLRDKEFGCEMICPISGKHLKFMDCSFIDDTDLNQSGIQEGYVDVIQKNATGLI
jgi:hypothetical protein